MIACSKCKVLKGISSYSFRNKSTGVRHVQCKDCIRVNTQKHYVNNKEEYKSKVKNWVENNKEQRRRNAHNSYALNKGYPPCTCCLKEELDNFMANRPEGCHIDHIKTVKQGGKHCLTNLQYLSISEHCRKSRYERN
jgi:hypothetical protein